MVFNALQVVIFSKYLSYVLLHIAARLKIGIQNLEDSVYLHERAFAIPGLKGVNFYCEFGSCHLVFFL